MIWYSRIKHAKRHLNEFSPYITIEKVANLMVSILEKHFRIVNLKSYPIALKIEPTPLCQLKCPLCLHKDPQYNKKFKLEDNLTKDRLIKIIEPLKNK